MRHVSMLVIHCSASKDGVPVSVETIREWHLARGFTDIGYHFVIDVDGAINPGRPVEEPGAHAKGFNAHSLGICLVGGSTGHGRYSQAQWDSLRDLVDALRTQYAANRIVGHRDLSPDLDGDGIVEPNEWIKMCPSFDVANWLAAGMVADPTHIFVKE